MKIVIVGAGFTGSQLAKRLINGKNDVVLIDNDESTVRHASNRLDCNVIQADGNNLDTLEDAGIEDADALVCVTSNDEVNMITCSLVDAVYPDVLKIARVRNYAYYVNTAKAEKKHSGEFGGKHRPLYGINYMIHPDVEAADAIVQAVENGAVGNVITFDNSDLEIARIMVNKDSVFDGISLKEIRGKTEIRFLVAYVEQEGVTSLPTGDTVIKAGNTLGVLVDKNDINALLELCGSVQKELRRVVLIGAGRIGTIIADKLIQKKTSAIARLFGGAKAKRTQDFVIIDSDDALAKAAAERFPDARVLCADASDENMLREEGLTNFDLAICATHNHELNMILAAYLESLGVGQSVGLVRSHDFVEISEKHLGVDVAIPLRDSVVDSIMSHLRGKSVKEIHTITTGELEIVECEVTSDSKVTGKSMREISDPGSFLVLLDKKLGTQQYAIPGGDTQIVAGDHVVLITKSENSKKILSYFAGKQ
jgi:trk system potassium uptake protein TrkA